MTLKNHQTQDSLKREIYSLYLPSSKDLPDISLPSRYFVCFIVWNAQGMSFEELTQVAVWLLSKGCCYFCTWGSDCGRLETAMDLVIVDSGIICNNSFDQKILTTSHQDETWEEALSFAFNTAMPDDIFEDECRTTLILVIGNEAIYQKVNDLLKDPFQELIWEA